jgi:hypothetical protein
MLVKRPRIVVVIACEAVAENVSRIMVAPAVVATLMLPVPVEGPASRFQVTPSTESWTQMAWFVPTTS